MNESKIFYYQTNSQKYKLDLGELLNDYEGHWPESWRRLLKELNSFKYIILSYDWNVNYINYYPVVDNNILWDLPFYYKEHNNRDFSPKEKEDMILFHDNLSNDIKNYCSKILLLSGFW